MIQDSPGADSILEATHTINGKEASIRRILYVCKIPENATAEELKNTFSEFGKVEECDFDRPFWMGFGLIVFDSEKVVDELAAKGTIEFCGEHLEVKKVEPLKVPDIMDWEACEKFRNHVHVSPCGTISVGPIA